MKRYLQVNTSHYLSIFAVAIFKVNDTPIYREVNFMKSRLRCLAVLPLLAVLVVIAACSSSDKNNGDSAGSPSVSAASGSPSSVAPESAAPDPLGKYDPPIAIRTTGASVSKDFISEGDTVENSVWTRGYESELGIKVKYDWIVENPGDALEKMNVTLASGDLPDLLLVTPQQYAQLKKADKLEDLTDVYNNYASEMTKDFYEVNDRIALKSVTSEGRIFGLTRFGGTTDTSPMVWIRQDWLKKTGLPEPQTMQDLIAIAKAFTDGDPDGNDKKDTRGILLSKDLDFVLEPGIGGFANGYNAYMNSWIRDASGQLVYGSIQPEAKQALAVLQDLYKAGAIDPEFGVKDGGKAYELANADKAGMFFGLHYNPFQVAETVKKDANIDWKAYPIPSVDGTPAKVTNKATVDTIYAIRKGYEHPEALIKLLNFQIDKMYGANSAQDRPRYLGKSEQGFHLSAVYQFPQNKNLAAQRKIVTALETNEVSALNAEEKGLYDGILKYRAGDRESWWYERIFGPESSQGVIAYYVDNNLILQDEFVYPPTPTMTTKKATLDKLELETFTKIIYGESPVDDFDRFVEQWKKLGGDEITAEVNEIAK